MLAWEGLHKVFWKHYSNLAVDFYPQKFKHNATFTVQQKGGTFLWISFDFFFILSSKALFGQPPHSEKTNFTSLRLMFAAGWRTAGNLN